MKSLKWLAIFGIGTLAVLWGGYVLSVLWGWFMVPVFGLPALTAMQAIGMKLTVRVITYTHRGTEGDDKSMGESLTVALVLPLALLGIGWIVKHWV